MIPPTLPAAEAKILDWYYANLEYACAADLSHLSMMNWDQDDPHEFQGQHLMLCDGYSSMLTPLSEGLDIVLNVRLVNPTLPQIDRHLTNSVVYHILRLKSAISSGQQRE
jgi:lysine-specific histone demethylase 1